MTLRRLLAGTAGALAVTVAAAGAAPAPAAESAPRPVVTLLAAQSVVPHPGADPKGAPILQPYRPVTGGPTVLPVVGRRTAEDGTRWLQVRLPGRPNGHKGWIRRARTVVQSTRWRLAVRTSERRVYVYRDGRLVRTLRAIVGKPATPTPHGHFFVEESVAMLPGSIGAPFALALSARSNVLQEFQGGPGQIAIHGRGGVGGQLGTAVSHGCVRLDDRSIRWLVARVAPGASVTIRP